MTDDPTFDGTAESVIPHTGAPDAPSARRTWPRTSGARSVLVRDQAASVAVMRCLDPETIADHGFQWAYPLETAALTGLDEPRVAVPRSFVVDAGGSIVASIRGYIEGAPLTEVLVGHARGLDVQTAATVAKEVLTGLAALHGRGVAHRCVSADQVIVRPDGTCVLVDAGLTPRAGGAEPGRDMVVDLAALADLFAVCFKGSRAFPRGRAHRKQAAIRLSEGLPEHLRTLLTGAALTHLPVDARAAGVLAAVESVAEDHFDAGWEDRGRDRLAVTAAASEAAHRPIFDFPAGWTERRPQRDRVALDAQMERNRQWLAGRVNALRRAATGTAAPGAEPPTGRHSTRDAAPPGTTRRRMSRYAGPLFAFAIAFTLVLIVMARANSAAGQLQANPTQSATPPGAAVPSPSPPGAAAVPIAVIASPSASSAPHVVAVADTRTSQNVSGVVSRRFTGDRSQHR